MACRRRQVTAALVVGREECGGATFHIDTGNPGISIADPHLATSLASAVGGKWDDAGDLVLPSAAISGGGSGAWPENGSSSGSKSSSEHDSDHVASSPVADVTLVIGAISAIIPRAVWEVGVGSGRTIFTRCASSCTTIPVATGFSRYPTCLY